MFPFTPVWMPRAASVAVTHTRVAVIRAEGAKALGLGAAPEFEGLLGQFRMHDQGVRLGFRRLVAAPGRVEIRQGRGGELGLQAGLDGLQAGFQGG